MATPVPKELARPEASELVKSVHATPELRDPLRSAHHAASGTSNRMTWPHMSKFFEDAEIPIEKLSMNDFVMDRWFRKCCHREMGMLFDGFLVFLARIAADLYKDCESPVQGLKWLLDEYVAAYTDRFLPFEADPSAPFSADSHVDFILYTHHVCFCKIFFEYGRTADGERVPPENVPLNPEDVQWDENGNQYRCMMWKDGFLRFARDFSIKLNESRLTAIMHASSLLHPNHDLRKPSLGTANTLSLGSDKLNMSTETMNSSLHLDKSFNESVNISIGDVDCGSELFLLEPEFKDAVVRLAYAVHENAHDMSMQDRLRVLLRHMDTAYLAKFGQSLRSSAEFYVYGSPVVELVRPQKGRPEGGYDLIMQGREFCPKKGVYIKFVSPHKAVISRARLIGKSRIIVPVPPFPSSEISFSTSVVMIQGGLYVEVTQSNMVDLLVSNDGQHYATVEVPYNIFCYEHAPPGYRIPETIHKELQRIHAIYSQSQEIKKQGYMTKDAWRQFLVDFDYAQRIKKKEDIDFVGKRAAREEFLWSHYQENGIGLNLAQFAGAVTQAIISRTHNLQPLEELAALLRPRKSASPQEAETAQQSPRKQAQGPDMELEEAKLQLDLYELARRMARILTRKVRCFDIFNGPLLLGTLTAKEGFVVPLKEAKYASQIFQYQEHDLMSTSEIHFKLESAATFDHLLDSLLVKFHLAPNSGPRKRGVIHRAWRLRHDEAYIGAVWEYPGQMATLHWQPILGEVCNPALTLMMYSRTFDKHVANVFTIYTSCCTIQEFRKRTREMGYELDIISVC